MVSYWRAAALGFVAALLLGATAGVYTGISLVRGRSDDPKSTTYVVIHGPGGAQSPPLRAVVYAEGIATGLNCAAFGALVLVPVALGALFVKRRIAARKN